MAMTVSASIQLVDMMTGPIQSINNVLNTMLAGLASVDSATDTAFSASQITSMQNELAEVDVQLAQIVEITNRGKQAQDKVTTSVNQTNTQLNREKQAQDAVNASASQGLAVFEGLKGKVMAITGAYLGMQGLRKTIDFVKESMSLYDTQLNSENQLASVLANMLDEDYVSQFEVAADTTEAVNKINAIKDSVNAVAIDTTTDTTMVVSEINSIQNNVDDVTVTVNARTAALESAFDDITAKASEIQSQGIYGDEAMIAGAAEFATYFSDPEAITTMMDTLADYAMGMTGGGEIDATSMVDYATNLGKIMSGSYDAMTKKGFEFTDVQKEIIEGTASEAEIAATLGEEYVDASADMQAAAAITQIIDEAWAGLYETMSDTPQGKIIQLTNAFCDMREVVGKELYPYIVRIVDTINENWGTIQSAINGFTTGLQVVLTVLSAIAKGALNVASIMIDNWDIIAPIIMGVVAALIAYNSTMGIAWLTTLQAGAAVAWKAICDWAETAAIFAMIVAQEGLNAALAACPITWIIVAIIALIAIIFAVCAAIAKCRDDVNSAFGVICGVISMACAFVWNTIVGTINSILQFLWTYFVEPFIGTVEWILNVCNGGFDSFGDAVANLIGQIISWFLSLGKVVTKIIDAIFGTDWTSELNSLQDSILAWGKNENAITLSREAPELPLQRIEYGAAWDAGTAFGDGISDKVSGFFGNLFGSTEEDTDDNKYSFNLDDFDDLLDSSDETAENTKEIAKKTSELADLVKDNREKEAIAKYTSNTPIITYDLSGMTNTYNNTSEAFDAVKELGRYLNKKRSISAEGV